MAFPVPTGLPHCLWSAAGSLARLAPVLGVPFASGGSLHLAGRPAPFHKSQGFRGDKTVNLAAQVLFRPLLGSCLLMSRWPERVTGVSPRGWVLLGRVCMGWGEELYSVCHTCGPVTSGFKANSVISVCPTHIFSILCIWYLP